MSSSAEEQYNILQHPRTLNKLYKLHEEGCTENQNRWLSDAVAAVRLGSPRYVSSPGYDTTPPGLSRLRGLYLRHLLLRAHLPTPSGFSAMLFTGIRRRPSPPSSGLSAPQPSWRSSDTLHPPNTLRAGFPPRSTMDHSHLAPATLQELYRSPQSTLLCSYNSAVNVLVLLSRNVMRPFQWLY